MSSAAQKTPISLLQELCVQQGITADYKLMSVEGAVHAPTFMYRVQVGEVVATATGASKKKAKHAAAKAALEKLLTEEGGFAEGFVSDGVMINAATLSEVIASSSTSETSDAQLSEDVKGNPVGSLQEHCMSKRWQPPFYETKDESGLPHERIFTVECQVEDFVEQGIGKSKRLAKRQAAQKMMERLKLMDSLNPKEETDGKDDAGSQGLTNNNSSTSTVESSSSAVESSMSTVESSAPAVESSAPAVESSASAVESSASAVESSASAVESSASAVESSMSAVESSASTVESTATTIESSTSSAIESKADAAEFDGSVLSSEGQVEDTKKPDDDKDDSMRN